MSERKHELTDEDIRVLTRRAADLGSLDKQLPSVDNMLSALPSRQPKDPDAGLGAQPYTTLTASCIKIFTSKRELVGYVYFQTLRDSYDAETVARSWVAAPKAIRLARKLYGYRLVDDLSDSSFGDLLDHAAEVLAIADGTGGES